ncbi:MAG: hypothetical protein RMJ98_13420, partial [Myxococcales bacterium]|nr:hypothetical protein [Myxococcales bacterium]
LVLGCGHRRVTARYSSTFLGGCVTPKPVRTILAGSRIRDRRNPYVRHRFTGRVVEAPHVGIQRVEAAAPTASQVDRERVAGQVFQVEHARATDDEQIQQKTNLVLHWVDDRATDLERSAHRAQQRADAEVLDERVEGNQAPETGERRVVRTEDNPSGVGTTDAGSVAKPRAAATADEVAAHNRTGVGSGVVGALGEGGDLGRGAEGWGLSVEAKASTLEVLEARQRVDMWK